MTRTEALELMQACVAAAKAVAPALGTLRFDPSWAKADALVERAAWWAQIAEALRELGRQ